MFQVNQNKLAINQNKLARATGLSISVIHRALHGYGDLTVSTAIKICKELGMTVEEFHRERQRIWQATCNSSIPQKENE